MQANVSRLLVVDDLAENRNVLTRRFVRRGFEVVEAESGEMALDLIDQQEFDAVLLDFMMQGMNGNQTLAQIRTKYTATELPVIMVTAMSQSEDVVASLRLGANDYVTKPVDFNVALARVVNHIEVRRAERELIRRNEELTTDKTLLEKKMQERAEMLQKARATIQVEATARAATEDRIAYLASYDALTDLPNRSTFDEHLRNRLSSGEGADDQLSLLFVDLDGFKNVNDTLGHAVGDELLKDVAQRIRVGLGPNDFCARLGGDEFAIIHTSEDVRSTAPLLAESLITAIAGCRQIAGSQVFVGASIGIAETASERQDPATLTKQADLAMYQAKADGRGVYRVFETEMANRAESRRQLEIDLREALVFGALQVYYQPVVDLRLGKVVSVEALLRWNHPTRGPVPPMEFVTLAEETGLIVQIGEWVMRYACAEFAKWPGDLRLAINLSPVQFRNSNLLAVVVSALSAAGLAADRLELEVTESVLLDNKPQYLRILQSLRELGVRIALDDFGTGCSGLGYLRLFPFDRIKIDSSFVQEMLERSESLAIVRAAIGVSHDMGISMTAEGVETPEQLESLLEEGCSVIQGFLFSCPQPGADIARTVEEIRGRLDSLTSDRATAV